MRILFVDDSGKPSPNHPSRFVVVGGFSVDAQKVNALTSDIFAYKAVDPRHWKNPDGPMTGDNAKNPYGWEFKAKDYLKPWQWQWQDNRSIVWLLLAAMKQSGGIPHAAVWNKSVATDPAYSEQEIVSNLLIRVATRFSLELAQTNDTGLIVSDWSTQDIDRTLAIAVRDRARVDLHPGLLQFVTYADSFSTLPLQVADLIAGLAHRRSEALFNALTDPDARDQAFSRDVGTLCEQLGSGWIEQAP